MTEFLIDFFASRLVAAQVFVVPSLILLLIYAAWGAGLNHRVVPFEKEGMRYFRSAWFISVWSFHRRITPWKPAGMEPRPIPKR
jgi:hypothetical protein